MKRAIKRQIPHHNKAGVIYIIMVYKYLIVHTLGMWDFRLLGFQ